MTDKEKLEKIRAEIERRIKLHKDSLTNPIHQGFGLQKVIDAKISELTYLLSFTNSMQEEPVSKQNLSNVERIGKNWKEPVSEDLDKAAIAFSKHFGEWDYAIPCFKAGAKWQKEHLWKPADGDDLPEYDREVIAILDYDFGHYKVVYAHRPNPNGWNGTNIDTEEKEHFEPEIYDKGGWNQPHVLYWLDTILPYEENKIDKEIKLEE